MAQPTVKLQAFVPGVSQLDPSFFDARIWNNVYFNPVGSPYTVYDAWCADNDTKLDIFYNPGDPSTVFSMVMTASVYSSYELGLLAADIPNIGNQGATPSAYLNNLDLVNWMLNQNFTNNGYTYGEVQGAIYTLLGDVWSASNPWGMGVVDGAKVNQLVVRANEDLNNDGIGDHEGYVPGVTNNIAVILNPHRDDTGAYQQPLIIQTKAAAIGDYVWNDANGNGFQDVGESGVAGVTVNLVRDINGDGDFNDANELLATTTTDAAGYYQFLGLTPSLDYQVQFVKPAGSIFTIRDANGNSQDAVDSDADLLTGASGIVNLHAGEFNRTVDAGLVQKAHLGDFVWEDKNANGQQDAGETGIAGVTVNLKDAGGNLVASTTTGANGGYGFDVLPGTYSVQIVAPGGYYATLKDVGNDASDSDIDAGGLTGSYTLNSGDVNNTVDAGLYRKATLGDRVWIDSNGNGQQDAGELGKAGVTVNLLDAGGATLATQTTDANGNYLFTGLTPGSYAVQFIAPAGYLLTSKDVGADASDSDADLATGKTGAYVLASGDDNRTVDAGLVQKAHLGDFVWEDKNANGQQDAGETGIAGVTVNLKDAGGNLVASTTTGANGGYGFDVLPGTYSVQIVAPGGYYATLKDVGNDASDSDIDAGGLTGSYTLNSGDVNNTVDAGLYRKATLGDRVWIDSNGNGQQDAGELGKAGVTVNLLDAGGATLATQTTDANGNYLFTGLTPGSYAVQFIAPAGYLLTSKDVGADASDSDADLATGKTGAYVLASGDDNRTVDAGLVQKASLGDRVWIDTNHDGLQNDGATGVSGLTVTLTGGGADKVIGTADDTTATTLTGADGYYQFTGLNIGEEYQVQFSKPAGYVYTTANVGLDDGIDSDADAATGKSQIVTLGSGEHNSTLDAGLILPNVGIDIEKYVRGEYTDGTSGGGEGLTPGYWKNHTVGKNGQDSEWVRTGYSPTDSYEAIFGVDVPGNPTLLDALKAKGGGVYALMRHSTAALLNASDGYIDYLYGKAEVIAMTQQAISSGNTEATKNLFDTQNNLGADLTTPASSTTTVITPDYDADTPSGPYIPVGGQAVFTYVVKNTGDVALSNIQVNDDRLANLVFVGGDSNHNGLLDLAETWTYTASEMVTTAGLHLNIGTVTGVDMTSGLGATDSDAAYYSTSNQIASIGDRVWLDANANGIQDAGEDGLEGITVNLLDAAGFVLASMETDVDGNYLFDGLAPGDYAVQVATPDGYFVSPKDVGGNTATADAIDSDIDPLTGKTIVTTLSAGENDMSWDAGLYQKASIGDKVWLDCNGNGIQDANEIGLSGVTVNLLSGAGAVLGTTTTDYLGNYLFSNLNPGSYAIQVLAPNGYNFTARDQGGNDALDSDVDPVTGKTIATTLASGQNDLSWDAGLTTVGACVDLTFSGSTATDGPDGNLRGYNQNGLSVNVSAFSRDKSTGAWATAWLGSYGGGLGVTDSSEGSGGNNSHTVDNVGGRDNYVMFEFSQIVMLDKAYLGYVVGDSDMQVWIGNFNSPYTSHMNLSDAVLSSMGFMEVNTTTLTTSRWADLNAGEYVGNTIVIAADTTDTTPEDYFKIQTLSVCTPACGLTASIGDRVWLDANANGLQDTGEAGIANVTVNLLNAAGAIIATTATNSGGNYLFSGLTPGDYAVQVVAPSGYRITAKDQGGNDATDSDFDPTTGKTVLTTLSGGENDMTWDAGLVQQARIGDLVWEDRNYNGIQDAGEAGIANVSVKLLSSTGAVLQTTYTDANGNYGFNVDAGSYKVQVIAPSGYFTTKQDQGTNDGIDSDINASGMSGLYTVTTGQQNLTVDGGLYQKASIGDKVWLDNNGNGIQDAGEAGISGVTVKLLNTAGTVLATTTTNASGNYLFSALNPGDYAVQIVAPTGYTITGKDQGGNDDTDSDFDPATGKSIVTTLTSGQNDLSWDAGLYKVASIGDKVWCDVNGNGIQNTGEAGISGVTVNLLNAAGAIIATTTTNSGGNYLFSGLTPGDYAVQVVAPSGYRYTTRDAGTSDASDSDVDTTTGKTGNYTLVSGQSNLTVDAGLVQQARIGDLVWEDRNYNGIQDAGEAGIANVSVKLLSSTGAVLQTTYTDANGNYGFNVDAGSYKVQVIAPSGYFTTKQDQGTNDGIDSDINASGMSGLYTVTTGQQNLTVDGGLYQKASIGDKVWLDNNGNGIQDAGEAGISGVTVKLLNTAGTVLATTTTNASGNYLFSALNPGDYAVQIVAPTGYTITGKDQGGNDDTDSDFDPATGKSIVTTLTSGQNDLSWDAGLYKVASIGDKVWCDVNGNGIQNTGEAGISGVTVNLLNAAGAIIATTTTNSGGNYLFSGLTPGDYAVQVVAPSGYRYTTRDAGTSDASDSDVDTTTGKTGNYTLVSGQSNLTVDAGLVQQARIGDLVWEDRNYNGIQDAGEAGIANVSVKLLSSTGAVLQTTYTDANGNYGFNVDAGSYKVQVIAPSGYFTTKQDQGTNDGIDSDINASGVSGLYTVTTGQQNLTVDGGLYRKASLGDKVWDDMNHNNLQDASEPGISGITVKLLSTTGSVLSTTTTDTSGNYLFANLDPGVYRLQFDKTNVMHYNYGAWYNMNDWKWAVKDVGGNNAIDSDVTGDAISKTNVTQTDLVTLVSGQNDMSWDAGITPIVIDLNGDGIQTLSRAHSTGAFDLLGTGKAIQSGWLSGEDGFLAWDRNGNGRIDDISELFGGNNKGDGYAKLAAFDSNGDGVVDAHDAAFADLRIWRDANGNHQTDAGELMTLREAGVASISLAYQALPLMDGNGNLHLERGCATMADGSTVDMTDVYFGISAADVTAAGIELPSLADLMSDSGSLDGLLGAATPAAPFDFTATASNDTVGVFEGGSLEAMKQLANLVDQQAAYA